MAGTDWARFARLGGDDYVLDHIAIDPQNANHIYVSAWSVSSQQIGDIFRTRDGGRNWETLPAMHGKSIRAMAVFHGEFQGAGSRSSGRSIPQQRWRRQLGTPLAR